MNGYCVKCRSSTEIKSPVAFTTKNGKAATKGQCGTCGTTMVRIGKLV